MCRVLIYDVFLQLKFGLVFHDSVICGKNNGYQRVMRCLVMTIFKQFFLVCVLICTVNFGFAQNDSLHIPNDSLVNADSLAFDIKNHKSSVDTEVKYGAEDSVLFDLKKKLAYLYKNAWIEYGAIRLEAAFIIIDFDSKDIFARGIVDDSTGKYRNSPIFKDGEQLYEADSMKYNFLSKKGLSKGVLTTEKDGFIHGSVIVRDSLEHIYVKDAKFTTCNLPEPHFHISAKKIKIIPKKQIVTGPANLMIGEIKTPLVVPFGFFPTPETKSHGIIMPQYGESPDRGFFFRGMGYYVPINDYLDVKVTGDFYFRGSWGLGIETNYAKRYRYNGNLAINYNRNETGERGLSNINIGEGTGGLGGFQPFNASNDIRILWTFNQSPKAKPNQTFSANVRYVTSSFLANNTLNMNSVAQNNANSSVNYIRTMFGGKLTTSINSNINQILSTQDVDITLPNFTATLQRLTPFSNFYSKNRMLKEFLKNLGFSYTGSFDNRIAVKEQNLFTRSALDSARNGASHSIPIATSFKAFKWFSVNPSFSMNEYWHFRYQQQFFNIETGQIEQQPEVSQFNRLTSLQGNVSVNTRIYGLKQFKDKKLMGLRHLITPSLDYRWKPDYTQMNKFGNREFIADSFGTIRTYNIFQNNASGRLSGGSQSAVGFSVLNNLEIKVRNDKDTTGEGSKKIAIIEGLTFNGNYNFAADSFQLSDISISGFTSIASRFRINYNAIFDPYRYVLDTFGREIRTSQYEFAENNKLGKLMSFGGALSFSLNPDAFKSRKDDRLNAMEEDYINRNIHEFLDFNIPWNVSVNYNFRLRNSHFQSWDFTENTFNINGDLSLTDNWKIVASTGYDLSKKVVNNTVFGFVRQLHCWEFSLDWNPLGAFRQFAFSIHARPGSLESLKLTRRRNWYDNTPR